jgi:hypothetical protein
VPVTTPALVCLSAGDVQIFVEMIPLVERQARCMPLLELQASIVKKNCPEIKTTLGMLSNGFLLSAVGLTFAALFICSCWRKLVKVAKKVAPGEAGKSAAVLSKPDVNTAI